MNSTMDIVVIDDDPADLELISRISNDVVRTCEIHTVQQVEMLEENLRRHAPKVVFVDHYLGAATGTELIEQLHQNYPHIAFVLLTARGDEKIVSEALRAGATDYLRKDELCVESLSALLDRVSRRIQEKEYAEAALAILHDGIITLDENHRIVRCNVAIEHLLGEEESELIGRTLESLLKDEDRERVETAFALAGGDFDEPLQVTLLSGDGGQQQAELTVSSYEVGLHENYIAIIRSQSGKRRPLQRGEKQDALIATTSDFIGYGDAEGYIQFLNPAARSLLGVENYDELNEPLSIYDLFPAAMQSKLATKIMPRVFSGGRWIGDGLMQDADKRHVPVSIVMNGVRNADGQLETITFIMRDISAEKARQERLYRAANYDALTGLANRSFIRKQIERVISLAERHGRRFALLYLDLDHFKQINDSFGHEGGDELLKVVAERLLTTVRSTDLVARLGGDEFVIVMEEIGDDLEMVQLADRILTLLRQPVTVRDQELHLSASIGIADFPDCGRQVADLLHKADAAMYKAKLAGRDRAHCFSSELTGFMAERQTLAGALRDGLARDEMQLAFEPVVGADGHIAAVRADLYWHRPDGPTLCVDEYLDTAIKIGLHNEMQHQLVTQLSSRFKKLSLPSNAAAHPQLRLVLAASQLADPTLVHSLLAQLRFSNFKPYRLAIEFPERVLGESASSLIDTLSKVREGGFDIVMRNFKLQHSAIDLMKSLPLTGVQLCEDLVRESLSDKTNAKLIDGLASIAHGFGFEVTAGPVTNGGQWELLRQQQVDLFSGPLFALDGSKPAEGHSSAG